MIFVHNLDTCLCKIEINLYFHNYFNHASAPSNGFAPADSVIVLYCDTQVVNNDSKTSQKVALGNTRGLRCGTKNVQGTNSEWGTLAHQCLHPHPTGFVQALLVRRRRQCVLL